MDRRFELRKDALLAEAEVDAGLYRDTLARLEEFVKPFADRLWRTEQAEHALEFVSGLISDLDRKNSESIAYRHDQDRKNLQHFIGQAEWDHQPLMLELARQVGQTLGRADGVLVFDPSGFAKKGTRSVGVQRQWCGRLGKVENCQVAVYLGYVSAEEHALVNTRLYLPKDWAQDRARRKACHVPRQLKYHTRHALCLEMLAEVGHLLPHRWIAGDDELGRSSGFRRELRERDERYLLAVPSNTLVRDLEVQPPTYAGRGGPPKTPFRRVERWRESLAETAWTKFTVRDGAKGPLEVAIAKCRVRAKSEGQRIGPEEVLVVIRLRDEQGGMKHDYYLSNAPAETPLAEFARVAKAEHRIEECIQRGKSETGLGDYEVRGWSGWYHHQVLSLIAAWFVLTETRRGKKIHSGDDVPPDQGGHRRALTFRQPVRWSHPNRARTNPPTETKSTRAVLSLETPKPFGTTNFRTTANLGQ
jgi:SRSO17 transposase